MPARSTRRPRPAPAWAQSSEAFTLSPVLTDQAVFACSDLDIAGNSTVDSWGIFTGEARGEEGHVRSNADITLDGTVEIYGDAIAGPTGTVVFNGTPLITGTASNATELLDCRPIDLVALEEALLLDNDNDLVPLTEFRARTNLPNLRCLPRHTILTNLPASGPVLVPAQPETTRSGLVRPKNDPWWKRTWT